MLGRICFTLLPLIFCLGILVTALLSFFGSWKTNLSSIYFMDLDLSNVSVGGVQATGIIKETGLNTYYQIGVNGYCWGSNGTTVQDCASPTTPYWFDLVGILKNSTVGTKVVGNLPSQVNDYENVLKGASYTMWGCFIAVMALSGIMFILGVLSFCAPAVGCCLSMLGALTFFLALVAAGIATGMYKIYSDKFNETVETFGARASLGNSGLAVAWICVAAALITEVLWSLTACCFRNHRRPPIVQAPVNFNTGYAPVHGGGFNEDKHHF